MAEQRTRNARRERVEDDPELLEVARLMGRMADELCGASPTFLERSLAMRKVAEAMLARLEKGLEDADERKDPES